MIEPLWLFLGLVVPALAGAAVMLTLGRRTPAAWPLALAAGYALGHFATEGLPRRWPPPDAAGRLLLWLLPAALAVELWAPRRPRLVVWFGRLALAAALTPVLLHHSVYLAELAGPGSRRWSGGEALGWLVSISAMLAAAWYGLDRLERGSPTRRLPLALALTLAAGGLAVALTGSQSMGQLLASLAATTAATAWVSRPTSAPAQLGLGLYLLAGVLVIGQFFSELPAWSAGVLLLAPLAAGLASLPRLRARSPLVATLLGLAATVAVCSVAVAPALLRFLRQADAATGY